MRSVLRALTKIAVVLFTTCVCLKGVAQDGFTINYQDSVQATDSSVWLSNDLKLTNTSSQTLSLKIDFIFPANWDIIGKKSTVISIEPGGSKVVPLNFIRRPQALAKWQPAEINILNTASTQTYKKIFFLKSNPISKFSVVTEKDEIIAGPDTKYIDIAAKIRNNGNVDEELTIEAFNALFALTNATVKKLSPNEEYVFKFRVRLTESIKKSLIKESVRIGVKNKAYLFKVESAYTNIYYTGRVAKQHISSHPLIPVGLESGVMYFSNTLAYYAGIRGSIPLNKDRKLDFSYRTKQLGIANSIERNVFTLEYQTKKWRLYAGELSDLGSFYAFGQGFSVTHYSPKKTELNVSAIIHYRENPFKSDVFSSSVKYNVKKASVKHLLAVNSLPNQGRFAFAVMNEANIIQKELLRFSIKAHAGENHYMFDVPGRPKEKAGVGLGYSFTYKLGKLDIASDYFKASTNYPGILSGIRSQSHGIGFSMGKFNTRVFYQYNFSRNNNIIFLDSVYNTNFFDIDFEKYGLQLGYVFNKNFNMSASSGKYRQTGNYGNMLPSALYFDLNASYRKGRNFSVRFMTMNGYNDSYNDKGESIWINRTNLMINTKFGGIRAFYTRTPTRRNNNNADSTAKVVETYSISPFMKFTIMKKLSIDVSYNFSKSLFDNTMSTFLGGNISYTNTRNGLDIRMLGNIPITNTSKNFSGLANNSMILSAKKNLNIPFFFRKKYYDMKIVLFKDDNGNSKFDDGEEPLSNITINVSDRLFITNKKGVALYQNIDKKYYVLDLSNVQAPRGYIPGNGTLQFINVEKDITYEVPYQKGMVISGNVKVTLDPHTQREFTAERIKITVSDSLNNYFKTLADANGNFFVNVPPGKYKVSLNPDAFTNDLQPVKLFYMIEVGPGKEEATVNFEIKEKIRAIRYLKKQ